jgi:hypothetical protein
VSNNSTNLFSHSDRYSIPFFELFLFSIIVLWLPIKLFAYIVPFLCITWFFIRANSGKSLLRFIFFTLMYVSIICFYVSFYSLMGKEFIVQNSIIFFLTYGSFFFFLFLPPNASVYKVSYLKYIRVIKGFIVIESLLGIFQVLAYVILSGDNFDSSTGDRAQGTLNPLSFLDPGANFNNQIYTTNLLLLLLFYTPYAIAQRKGIWICILASFAIILASVWHLFLVFLIAVVIITFYFNRSFVKFNFTRLLIILVTIFCVGFIANKAQPKNFVLISFYLNKMTSDQSPKTVVTLNSFSKLPLEYPWVSVIGLGPGQYSSRAGLIGTGKYFGRFNNPNKVPFIHNSYSHAFQQYLYPQWEKVALNSKKYGNSTMSRPFYSILSVAIEFGYLIFAIITILVFGFIIKIKKLYLKSLSTTKRLKPFYALSCAIAVLFFFLISFFENYMELTQAIFPGLLILKFFYTSVKSGEFA